MNDIPKKMTSSSILDEIAAMPVEQWPPALQSIIADRLELAIMGDASENTSELAEDIHQLLNHVWRQASTDVRKAAQGEGAGEDLAMAYQLGFLNFAHQMAATSASHQAGAAVFMGVITNAKYHRVLTALQKADCSKQKLVAETGLPIGSIEEQIPYLMEAGIIDFTVPGLTAEYFLTPAAKGYFESKNG